MIGNFGFHPCSHGDFLGTILGIWITIEKKKGELRFLLFQNLLTSSQQHWTRKKGELRFLLFQNLLTSLQQHWTSSNLIIKKKDWNLWIDAGKNVVMRENIEAVVRRVMMIEKAKVLGEMALKAIKEGGSSHKNLTVLIEELEQLRDQRAKDD
ncbi:hypothetical protein TEA_020097 [Camellia sinensis var. sinensis]|uniref:Uncharacterized protein n=1 Tax=Camellia sinensis var. sinensis TaxID=542762 RepID=A0A4S4D7Z0_CAMSN|nr:hypothetical protein TEA_020097 [Camellia sinensis var. sinensis]